MKGLALRTTRGLYAITNGPRPDLPKVVAQALAGGTRLLQYRDESGDSPRRQHEATALRQLCRAHGVPLIIDADVTLALAVGADGVHLDDVAGIGSARATLGDQAIIGVSCRASLPCAQESVRTHNFACSDLHRDYLALTERTGRRTVASGLGARCGGSTICMHA